MNPDSIANRQVRKKAQRKSTNAKPNNPEDVVNGISEIGVINDIVDGVLGMEIKKSGRSSGLTTGTIDQIDVTVRVNFCANKVAAFEDQLMAGPMSQGGDSGSVVLDRDNNLTGLLFAGSSTTTVINRIQNVFSELNVRLPDTFKPEKYRYVPPDENRLHQIN